MIQRPLLQQACCIGLLCRRISSTRRSRNTNLVSAAVIDPTQVGIEEKVFQKKTVLNFPEKTVSFYSCENIYNEWKKQRTFLNIPQSGVYAKMHYIDTVEHTDAHKGKRPKTVLCIHGIPGNYGVFNYLIRALSDNGVRVIAPTFPGALHFPGKYNDELFRHSLEEKTQVFKDFLKALNISEVDCIVSHSCGIYPALQLVLDPALKVKSQVLFNTGGHKATVAMKPYWLIKICVHLYLNSLFRAFMQKTGRFIMKNIIRSPIRDNNMDGIFILAMTMVYSQFWKTKELFADVARRQIPTLYCFSEDDKVVEKELTYEILSLLGASEENVNFYDKQSKLKEKGKDLSWIKLLSFEEGSHYVFRKHPEVINQKVVELLREIDSDR